MLNEIAKAAVMDPTPVLAVILVPSKTRLSTYEAQSGEAFPFALRGVLSASATHMSPSRRTGASLKSKEF